MKKIVLLAAVILLATCADVQDMNEMLTETRAASPDYGVQALMEKARRGDGEAYLRLADSYRDGAGVERDFVNMMTMAFMAEQYGGIESMDDYFETLPEDSEFKILISAMNRGEKAVANIERLAAMGSHEADLMRGIKAIEQRDTIEGMRLMQQAATNGSSLAKMFLCLPELNGRLHPDVAKLTTLAERMPIAYQILAKCYSGKDDGSHKNEALALHYYLKAYEAACLTRSGAAWLVNYYKNNRESSVPDSLFKRFQTLTGDSAPKD